MHGETILIIGISGFIGTHLAQFLRRNYPTYKIIGLCRNPKKASSDFDTLKIDLTNAQELLDILRKTNPKYIFHLAGTTFSYEWDELYKGNVVSTINLLDAVKKLELSSRIVIAGSSAEYGSLSSSQLPVKECAAPLPLSPYGITKLFQTLTAKHYVDHPIMIGRIFNVIGNHLSPKLTIGSYLNQINKILHAEQEPRIRVGNLETKRDFLDVEDVCSGLMAIAKEGKTGSIYNICSGSSLSHQVILDLLLRLSKVKASIVFDENEIRNSVVHDIYGCNLKIKNDTNWKPIIPLEECLRKALNMT